jgi:hypothetical protein
MGPAAQEDRTVYASGVETIRLENGMTVAADHKGLYAMGFPAGWEVGAFDPDFLPALDKHAQTNPALRSLFDTIYQGDSSARIFAIDTSPDRLSSEVLTTIHVGMFQGEPYQGRTLDALTAEYVRYLESGGQIEVQQTLLGKSQYEVPFVILVTQSRPADGSPVYTATALIQTERTYVEALFTTTVPTVDIPNELNSILQTFSVIVE